MPKLYCPIPQRFLQEGQVCIVNQLFGENKNTKFYDERGHTGIDFRTIGEWKYRRNEPLHSWIREPREPFEVDGRIPILASHDGVMSVSLAPDKQKRGWGVWVTADPVGDEQWKTLYWHIETPWHSLRAFNGLVATITALSGLFIGKRVKANTRVAIAGNNGLSTGPHLHQELYIRKRVNGKWADWVLTDPMPYYVDSDVIYVKSGQPAGPFPTEDINYYKGVQISNEEKLELRKTISL